MSQIGRKSQALQILDLPIPAGWKAELTYVTGYIPRCFTRLETVTHPSTNPAVHGRESNSQSVDHKSDALTTTTLLSHLHLIEKSSIVTEKYRNKTNSLKIQRYNRTDCFKLTSM